MNNGIWSTGTPLTESYWRGLGYGGEVATGGAENPAASPALMSWLASKGYQGAEGAEGGQQYRWLTDASGGEVAKSRYNATDNMSMLQLLSPVLMAAGGQFAFGGGMGGMSATGIPMGAYAGPGMEGTGAGLFAAGGAGIPMGEYAGPGMEGGSMGAGGGGFGGSSFFSDFMPSYSFPGYGGDSSVFTSGGMMGSSPLEGGNWWDKLFKFGGQAKDWLGANKGLLRTGLGLYGFGRMQAAKRAMRPPSMADMQGSPEYAAALDAAQRSSIASGGFGSGQMAAAAAAVGPQVYQQLYNRKMEQAGGRANADMSGMMMLASILGG